MSRPFVTWLLAAALFAALAAAVLISPAGSRVEPATTGQRAPVFSMLPLDGGEPLSLEALRGRVVLLNFWATWCAPCEAEMPAMERLARQLASDPFTLVAISVDERASDVRAFRDRLALGFPILHGEGGREARAVAGQYGTFRYPETFLIDAEGKLLARFVGPRDWDDRAYVERIRRLIAGRSS
jgi:thiol-disulfide isomerase/thioredoxin